VKDDTEPPKVPEADPYNYTVEYVGRRNARVEWERDNPPRITENGRPITNPKRRT
jgi:hypothetical protein